MIQPALSKPLSGKTALITGTSKGLGKAMALALAGAGARVALVSRDRAKLDDVAAAVRALGAEAEVFVCDVTSEAQVRQLETDFTARCGKLQILVNNAGINIRKPLTDFTLDEWRQVLDTNLTSVFLVSRAFVPLMKGQGYGRILNMTSMLSHIALAHRTAYCASKAGLLGLTKALALELIEDKITVNGISPGPFATEINQVILQNPELSRNFLAKIPQGRFGNVEDIGQLALFLCSEGAGFITGTDIVIDGGWCAQ